MTVRTRTRTLDCSCGQGQGWRLNSKTNRRRRRVAGITTTITTATTRRTLPAAKQDHDHDLPTLTSSNSNSNSCPPARRSNVLLLPGFFNSSKQYRQMRQKLLQLGHPRVETVDISALEWLPALFAGSSFTFYLDKVDKLARELHDHDQNNQQSQSNTTTPAPASKLSIVGHSAGGWLARIWLGDARYDGTCYDGLRLADTLLTLGTPHLSVEEYPFGRVSEKRKGREGPMSEEAKGSSLRFANAFCGASDLKQKKKGEVFSGHDDDDDDGEKGKKNVKIICVAGNGFLGKEAGWGTRASYQCTCRKVNVDGDGVCPIESAILPGCDASLILDNVFHSPVNQSQDKDKKKVWYGDDTVVERWDALLP